MLRPWSTPSWLAKDDGRLPMEDHNTRILVVGRDKGEARTWPRRWPVRPSTTSPISPESLQRHGRRSRNRKLAVARMEGDIASSSTRLGMHEQVTLMHPGERETAARGMPSGFPVDLLSQSAGRLRILALLYAFVFFMAGVFPALLFPQDRARFLGSVLQWGPSAAGIAMALVVAGVVRRRGVSLLTAMRLAPAFEIVSSYAIAAAEFADPSALGNHHGMLGLSWVAVWVVLFTVVVPTSPRRAVVAALASVSSVPVIIGLVLASGAVSGRLEPAQFFFGLVFPYILIVGMAYVGARVVYQLGSEVKRARELGSYSLEEKLGQGGMGEVWRARHRLLARPAAIKVIRPTLAGNGRNGVSEEAVRRFEREAQVIARLRSPHTVNLFDFGIAADGAFYYAMELLDGLDADSLVRRFGPIAPERVVYLLRQVCHSLSEAQSHGLVHRDIKPANIFLCRYGEEYDFVKVLDFGIVGTVRRRRGREGCADARERAARHTGVHGAGAGDGTGGGRARRHLCGRLRRLLAPDRAVRVYRGDPDGAHPEACPDSTPTSFHANRAAHPQGSR